MEPKNVLENQSTKKRQKALSVCFFSHSAGLGGAERTLLELVTELIENYGVICTVILPEDGPLKKNFEAIGALTCIIDYSWWYDPEILPDEQVTARCINSTKNLLYSLKQVLCKINPDIIITNTMPIPWGAITASFLGKPHVWFIHEFGESDHGLKSFLPLKITLKTIKNLSTIILTNSEAVRKKLFPNTSRRKVLTIYQHINIPSTVIYQKENNYFSKTNSTKLIVSANIHEGKGQKDAILAVKELIRKGKDVELVLMGHCTSQYAEHLKAVVKQENLKEHVRFIGFKENPYPIMKQADIGLVCSKNEAFGRMTVEGMLLKKPIIGTNRGGTLELIKEGFNGLLYEPGDYNQLADKIEYLIDNPNKTKELVENGYEFVNKTFTKNNFGGKIYRLLLNLKQKAVPETSFSNLNLEGPALLDSLLAAAGCKDQKITTLITELGSSLKLKDSQITELTDSLQNRDTQITERDTQIAGLKNSLQEKEAQISEKEIQINSLEFQIQQIQQSILMQLAKRYDRIMERVLPSGTRRHHYYELCLTGIKIILNEGWHSFWFKLKQWLSNRRKWPKFTVQPDPYQLWIAQNELKAEELERQRKKSLSFNYRPKISIITPVGNTKKDWLQLTIESVLNQTYDNWELCLAGGNSIKSDVKRLLRAYANKDPRIKIKLLGENKETAGNSNEALSLATGEFVGFLGQNDEITPNSLYEVSKFLNKKPETDFIYSDEILINEKEKAFRYMYKPDFSPDYLLSHPYIGHLAVIRKKLLDDINGFREKFMVSQDYDLFLRIVSETRKIFHIPKVLYRWRVYWSNPNQDKDTVIKENKEALMDFLKKDGIEGTVYDSQYFNFFRVKRRIKGNPKVSIIIPARDKVDLTKKCINSIETKTTYKNYEVIIVDNKSQEAQTAEYLNYLKRKYPNYRVIKFNEEYNFSRLNNYAVKYAQGDHLLFLNNDTEVISPEWIEAMLEHSQREEVAFVGAKLLLPNNCIQHVGVVVGMGIQLGNPADHAYRFINSKNNPGYMGHFVSIRNWSALTAACMMVKKKIFDEIEGFDEKIKVDFGDTDICLKARVKGYLNVFTPYAELYHYERSTITSGPQEKDAQYFYQKWKGSNILQGGDPYYNPNLPRDVFDVTSFVENSSAMLDDNLPKPDDLYLKPEDYSGQNEVVPDPNEIRSLDQVEEYIFRTSTNPLVSIIIPAYNQWQYTYICLKSVLKNTAGIDYEIIVANDCSTDLTPVMLKKMDGIMVIKNKSNLGFIKNCNNAATFTKGKYILFLNNDTYVLKDWLKTMVESAEKDGNIGIIGPNLISANGKLQESGWIMGLDGWGQPIGRGKNPANYEYNYLREVDCVTGACLLIKKDIFLEVGSFDEVYAPAYYDEFDLAFAVRKKGYKVVVQPKAKVVHFGQITYGVKECNRLSSINRSKFLKKWGSVLEERSKKSSDYFRLRDRLQEKKVILVVNDKVLDYDKSAGSLTMYQYITLLQSLDFKVIFLPDNLERLEPYATEMQQLGIEVIYGEFNFDSWLKENGKYLDMVWLSRPDIAIKYIERIKKQTNAKILYYPHELHYLRVRRKALLEKDDIVMKESERLKEIEFNVLKSADITVLFSVVEKNIISKKFPDKRIEILPLYFFKKPLEKSKVGFETRRDIIFLGGFNHLPNIDAVLWFVKEIFPHILTQLPEMKLFIIGGDLPQKILDLASNNIIFTGYVKLNDLRSYFERARVFVAPLRYGAGLKGKIITSMYYGVPSVITTIANEGFEMIDGENALIADEPKEFAERVVELYTNKNLWGKLSKNSIELVKSRFSTQIARRKILSIIGKNNHI